MTRNAAEKIEFEFFIFLNNPFRTDILYFLRLSIMHYPDTNAQVYFSPQRIIDITWSNFNTFSQNNTNKH